MFRLVPLLPPRQNPMRDRNDHRLFGDAPAICDPHCHTHIFIQPCAPAPAPVYATVNPPRTPTTLWTVEIISNYTSRQPKLEFKLEIINDLTTKRFFQRLEIWLES